MVRKKSQKEKVVVAGEEDIKIEKGSNLIQAMRTAAIKSLGSNAVWDGKQLLDSVYGVPIRNNLMLAHILGVDVFACGRIMTVTGAFSATKSSQSFYIAKCFMEHNGVVVILDCEKKTNPDQCRAVFDNDTLYNQIMYLKPKTLTECIHLIKFWTAVYLKACPKKDQPFLIVWDSLNAVTSEDGAEAQRKSEDDAYRGARNAADVQEFLKYYTSVLDEIPGMLLVVNHLKQKIDGNANPNLPPPKYSPGGSQKDFQYTWNLELSKAEGKVLRTEISKVICMKPGKSSLGPMYNYNIRVPYVSWHDNDGLEHIYYDWDASLADFLTSDLVSKTNLARVMNLTKESASKYSSKTLGLVDVSASEMGKAIHANDALCEELKKHVLHIRPKRKFGTFLKEVVHEPVGCIQEGAAGGAGEVVGELAAGVREESDEEAGEAGGEDSDAVGGVDLSE